MTFRSSGEGREHRTRRIMVVGAMILGTGPPVGARVRAPVCRACGVRYEEYGIYEALQFLRRDMPRGLPPAEDKVVRCARCVFRACLPFIPHRSVKKAILALLK